MSYHHIPVMLNEVMQGLDPQSGQFFVDGTLGGAGYTTNLSQAVGEKGKVLAIDLDDSAIKNAQKIIKERGIKNITLVQDNFRNLEKIVHQNFNQFQVNGIVLDLGLSSAQVDEAERGFSFLKTAPLSLAFAKNGTEDAAYLVNNLSAKELTDIIARYGEDRFAFRIANAIVSARQEKPIRTTTELAEIVIAAVPGQFRRAKIHPATKTFQALRLAVNRELESLELVLPQAVRLLAPGGRLAIVSFHSLEDRIVKHFFKDQIKTCVCPPETLICNCHHQPAVKLITKKAIIPTAAEVKNNPRSRSAKLRIIEKLK